MLLGVWLLWTACALLDPAPAGEAVGHDASASRPLWLFREDGRGGFVRAREPFAHSFSSLGLVADGDRLVLLGLGRFPGAFSMWRRDWLGPPLHGLETEDLDTWDPVMWRLRGDPEDRIPIDPQPHLGEEGLEVYYYAAPSEQQGDPAQFAGGHRIARARVGRTAAWSEDVLTAPLLADPCPVTFQGRALLFATSQPGAEAALFEGDPLEPVEVFGGVSVPHAFVHDGVLQLWVQQQRRQGAVALRSTSEDGRTFTSFEEPLPMDGLGNCASPVGASFDGEVVVVCLDEALGEGP